MLRAGVIPARKEGNRWYVRRAAVEAFLEPNNQPGRRAVSEPPVGASVVELSPATRQWIREFVATAPPLTEAQQVRIAALLRPSVEAIRGGDKV